LVRKTTKIGKIVRKLFPFPKNKTLQKIHCFFLKRFYGCKIDFPPGTEIYIWSASMGTSDEDLFKGPSYIELAKANNTFKREYKNNDRQNNKS
jgi:hypothetical protein